MVFLYGETFGLKTEPSHRGMKFGSLLSTPDYWVQALPAGGDEGSRTPVRKPIHTAFFERSPSFKFPFLSAVGQALKKSSFFIHDSFKS